MDRPGEAALGLAPIGHLEEAALLLLGGPTPQRARARLRPLEGNRLPRARRLVDDLHDLALGRLVLLGALLMPALTFARAGVPHRAVAPLAARDTSLVHDLAEATRTLLGEPRAPDALLLHALERVP